MSVRDARIIPWIAMTVAWVVCPELAAADRAETIAQAGTGSAASAESTPARRKAAVGTTPAPLTLERETAALKFVEQHHAELAELLAALKPTSPAQYAQAMQDLFRASERINLARSRDPRRFELELQIWKTQSRRDLVAVRLRMARTPELESQLRQLIHEHLELQQALMRMERDRVAERLRKLDEQLASGNRTEQVEQQFQQLVSRPRTGPKAAAKNPVKSTSKPSAKPTGKTTSKSASTSAIKPATTPTTTPTVTPATTPTTKPADQPASKPTDRATNKPSDQPADKAAGKPADKAAEKAAGQAVFEPALPAPANAPNGSPVPKNP
ncbi:MAG: hypothetical protein RLY70_1153 [Planctomycetota bacterium]